MAYAAKRKGVITGVNFSYRNSANVQYAARLVKEGGLGRIIHVEASYLQSWLSSMHERFINSIKRGKQDKPDFEVDAKVQAYPDKIFQSNKLGKWVKV